MTGTTEQLTTGWEPRAPVGDTLLRRFLFHQAAANAVFARSAGGTTLDTPEVAAADTRRPAGYWNAATLLQPPADWTATLDQVEAFFHDGTGEAMLWSAWPTPDLGGRWRLSGHPPLLVRPPIDVAPAPGTATPDVFPVTTRGQLAAWEQVAIEGYPLAELAGSAAGSLIGPAALDDPRLRLWTARLDGQAVSAAAAFVEHGIGSLAFGATLPEARRRGLWHQLALTRLRATPGLWMTGVFSDFSRPGAERLGFVPVQRLTLWILDREGEN